MVSITQLERILGKLVGFRSELLSFSFSSERIGSRFNEFINSSRIVDTIEELRLIPEFEREIAAFLFLNKPFGVSNRLQLMHLLDTQIARLQKLVSSHVTTEPLSPDFLKVKLPDKMDFDEFADILHDLRNIFNICPPVREANNNDDVMVTGVESGSIWMILGISMGALAVVGKIMDLGIKFTKERQQFKSIEQRIRAYNINNEAAENLVQVQGVLAASLAKEFAEKQADNQYDGEEIAKITLAITAISDLISKAVQFQPPLDAPKEVMQNFPKLEDFTKAYHIAKGGAAIAELLPKRDGN